MQFIQFPVSPDSISFPITFCWEADWGSAPNWIVTYYAYSDFKGEFDSWYNNYAGTQPWFVGGNYQVFVVNIHHEPLHDDNNPTAAQARIDFAASIDYILSKGDVQILTEEQVVEAFGGTGNQNMVTIFSDGFESGDFTNPSGVGGPWISHQSSWSVETTKHHTGTHDAKAVASASNRILEKDLAFDINKVLLLDYWCLASSAGGSAAFNMALLFGPVEYIQPLCMNAGHFQYYDTAMHNLPEDTTYAANTWEHVQIYLDFPNSVVTWVINGNQCGSMTLRGADTGTLINPKLTNFTALKFYNSNTGGPTGYIDNVIIRQGAFMVPVKTEANSMKGD